MLDLSEQDENQQDTSFCIYIYIYTYIYIYIYIFKSNSLDRKLLKRTLKHGDRDAEL